MNTTRNRRIRACAWLVAVIATVLQVPLPPSPAAAQPTEGIHLVGTIDLVREDRTVIDNTVQRIFAVRFDLGVGGVISAFNGDGTLYKRFNTLPYRMPFGTSGGPMVNALDEAKSRLYLLAYPSDYERSTGLNPVLLVLDTRKVEIVATLPVSGFPRGATIKGLSYSPTYDRLYAVAEIGGNVGIGGSYLVQVLELDPATAAGTWPAPFNVPQCQKTVTTELQAAVVRNPDTGRIFVGCGTGNLIAVPAPGVPAIASIDVSDPSDITARLHPVAGSYATGESLFDAAAGRFIMVAAGLTVPSQAAWIFDEAREVYTGVVSAGDINIWGAAVNERTGRLYVGIDNALLVGSDRGLKIPQALQFPIEKIESPAVTAVPFNRTVIVNTNLPEGRKFLIYKDTLPAYVPPLPEDPDSATVQTDEVAGKTDVNFAGDALAFGARMYAIGGFNGMVQNISPSDADYWTLLGKPGNVNDGDRDAYFARVVKSHLSRSESSALSIATDRDANTTADYTNLSRQEWPWAPAQCADLGGGEVTHEGDTSTVACDRTKAKTTASAAHNESGATEVVSMGASTSSTELRRDPKLGLVTVSRAEVRDVVVGGVIRLGRVTSTAQASAKGRTGTANAEYTRTFENVSTPAYSCTDDCDPERVAAAINEAMGAKLRADLPKAELIATPGGARGSALRDPWEHQQDVVFNNQAATELQIPALRLTYVNDNASRSRLIYEFAGTQADAGYAVFLLPTFGGGGGGGGIETFFAGSSGSGSVESVSTTTVSGRPASVSKPPAENPLTRFLRRLGHGLRLALTGRSATVLNVLLWALLAAPVFMAARRRYLVRLMGEAT